MESNISHPDVKSHFMGAASAAGRPSCKSTAKTNVNIRKYWHHVECFELTDQQKEELLRTVWRIMESFADVSFGLHPAQNIDALNQENASEKGLYSVQSGIDENKGKKDDPAKLEAPGRSEA